MRNERTRKIVDPVEAHVADDAVLARFVNGGEKGFLVEDRPAGCDCIQQKSDLV